MNKSESCFFCQVPIDKRLTFGVSTFYGMYDSFPVSPGHMLIIPSRHAVGLNDLDSKEWLELQVAISRGKDLINNTDLVDLYEKIKAEKLNNESVWFCDQALKHPRINTIPDAYNYGINDGKAAGRTIDHFHWHIIPRFTEDIQDPRGGVRYVIPNMGNYKLPR